MRRKHNNLTTTIENKIDRYIEREISKSIARKMNKIDANINSVMLRMSNKNSRLSLNSFVKQGIYEAGRFAPNEVMGNTITQSLTHIAGELQRSLFRNL